MNSPTLFTKNCFISEQHFMEDSQEAKIEEAAASKEVFVLFHLNSF